MASSPPDASEQRLCGSIAPEAVLAPTRSRTSSKLPAMDASVQDTDISYKAQPAVEVSCRFGDTEHHTAFALLHLVLLPRVLSPCWPAHLNAAVWPCLGVAPPSTSQSTLC